MLEVKDLHVNVEGKELLKGISFSMDYGEIVAIMGHNASGKTTLALTLAGFPQYMVSRGRILLDGEEITGKSIDERARMGLALAFQSPPAIRGIKLGHMIALSAGMNPWQPKPSDDPELPKRILRKVNLEPEKYLDRELNVGFSGGERKRSELAQIFAMRPKLMILDEPDSGVDIDSLKILGTSLKEHFNSARCGVMIITHHRHILQYLKPDRVHILSEGRIAITGSYDELMPKIEEYGYEKLIKEAEAA